MSFPLNPQRVIHFLAGSLQQPSAVVVRDLFMPLAEAELMILHKPKGQPDMLRRRLRAT